MTRKRVDMKAGLADMEQKRNQSISTKRDDVEAVSREVEEATREPVAKATPTTLPKVTLYAHAEVLKAIRLLAVQDGVQAQEILRAAVREYLAKRGHNFADLVTGK